MATAGTQGVSVTFGGAATTGVETRVRIRRRLNEIGDARLTMIGPPADLTIPEDGDTVEITDVGESRVLFGGNVRTPAVEIIDGGELLEVTVPCVGHEQRLQDTIISPADGIRIVQLDTAAEQIEEIVKLLEGEGFTTGTLPDLGDGQTTDMRFLPAYEVLRAIVDDASAVLIVSPDQEVTAPLLTALPDSGETLDGDNTTDPRRSVDPKDRRTQQYVIGGSVTRTLVFTGDGAQKDFSVVPGPVVTVTHDIGAPDRYGLSFASWDHTSGVSHGDFSALGSGGVRLLRSLSVNGNRQIVARFAPNLTQSASVVGDDLTPQWEDSASAIVIRAPGLSPLTLLGPNATMGASDANEPYSWRLTTDEAEAAYPGGIGAWATAVDALSSSERGQMSIVLSDGATATDGVSLDFVSIDRLTVDDVEQDVGGDGDWRFDVPSQRVIQRAAATALASSDVLRVAMRANVVAVDEVDDDPAVGRVSRARDVVESDAILARALSERESHSDPAERIRGGIAIDAKIHVDVGQTVAMDTAFAGLLQVDTPAAADTWVLSVVTIQTAGNLLRYGFSTQRDRYETESLDYWRELRAAPAD